MIDALPKIASFDIPRGTYHLGNGLVAVVEDSATPMVPTHNHCQLTGFLRCWCWNCRGFKSREDALRDRAMRDKAHNALVRAEQLRGKYER